MDEKPVLFLDHDGVVCDFWGRYHGLHADLCARYHLEPLGYIDYRNRKRQAIPELEILRTLGAADDVAQEMIDLRLELIEAPQYLALDAVYPGSQATLQALSARYRLVMVTARKDRAGVEGQLAAAGIAGYYWDLLIAGNRPKHELMRGYEPAVAMVGDSEHDIRAGKALGLTTVGVTGGIRDRALLQRAAPDHLVDGLADLPALRL